MQRIAINMRNYLMCQAIELALKRDGEFYTDVMEKPEEVVNNCVLLGADILLMEVASCSPWKLDERMKIRDNIKKQMPNCKIVLLVDENAERELARQVNQLKKNGLIDQFIYGSSSASYLTALLETL